MSWSLANSGKAVSAATTGPISFTFTEAVNSGDLVVVAVNCYEGSGVQGTVTVSDTGTGGSNTYSEATKSVVNQNCWSALEYSVVARGAGANSFTVSVSFSASQYVGIAFLHYTNPAGTIALDVAGSAGASSSSGSASLSLTGSGELVIGTWSTGRSGQTYTPASGFEALQSDNAGSGSQDFCCIDNGTGYAGSGTMTPGVTGSGTAFGWGFSAAAFKVTGSGVFTLAAAAGSYSLAGDAAALLAGRALPAAAGAYHLSGDPAALLSVRALPAAAGAYHLTGDPATLARAFTLQAAAGSYSLTGDPAALLAARRLAAAAGTYAIAGMPAALIFAGAQILVFCDPDAGSVITTADDAGSAEIDPDAGSIIIV